MSNIPLSDVPYYTVIFQHIFMKDNNSVEVSYRVFRYSSLRSAKNRLRVYNKTYAFMSKTSGGFILRRGNSLFMVSIHEHGAEL